MKRIKILGIAIFAFAALSVSAQQDIKLNISNAFLYEFNVSYEYMLSSYATVGAFGGYVYDFPDVSDPNTYLYGGPELRYYVSPKKGADRFFIGLYSRFKAGNTTMQFSENGYDLNNQYLYIDQSSRTSYVKTALGFTMGGKWVVNNGFVFGFFGGLGRNLFAYYSDANFVNNEALFDPDSYQTSLYSNGNESRYWDFRIGFNVGWRFGK